MAGRGMFGRWFDLPGVPATAPTPDLIAPAPAPEYRPPSTGRMIVGGIGDAIQQWAGGRATFAPMVQAQQQAAMEQAQYQRRQADQFATWQRQKEWERANPAPVNNDTIADYKFREQTLGKEAADAWLKSASDPIVNVTLPGNRFYSGPRSGLAEALGGISGGAAPTIPTAPVGKLKPLGGPTPRASGNFR